MTHRSYSAVKSLRTCGEQYRLERVEKVTQRPQAAAIAGRTVHQATELVDYEIASGETDKQVLFYEATRYASEVLDKEIEQNLSADYLTPDTFRSFGQSKLRPQGQDIEWHRGIGIPGSIQNYITWRLDTVPHYEVMVLPSGELAIEIPFEIQLSDLIQDPMLGIVNRSVTIRGQIDRVFVDTTNGSSIVLDVKNGPKPETTEQLGLYREAMNQLHPDGAPYFGSYLYGLKPGSKTGVRQTFPNAMLNWGYSELAKVYTEADQQIALQLFVPNPGKACFMCNVSDQCSFYQASIV